MIPNGEQMDWNGHNLIFESEPCSCRGCFFENRDSCPDCDEGIWVEDNPSPWHAGTPTEEGWYLVQHLSDAEYCGSKFFVARWDGEKFIINPRPPIVVTYQQGTAWQKIEPYEASKENT